MTGDERHVAGAGATTDGRAARCQPAPGLPSVGWCAYSAASTAFSVADGRMIALVLASSGR
ncbi:hypothetical protein EDF24_0445 [Curtobacterium sp. PhB130]|nr:hypothetical protein EDF24_0445 [Curtobacterium sp. PhB130]